MRRLGQPFQPQPQAFQPFDAQSRAAANPQQIAVEQNPVQFGLIAQLALGFVQRDQSGGEVGVAGAEFFQKLLAFDQQGPQLRDDRLPLRIRPVRVERGGQFLETFLDSAGTTQQLLGLELLQTDLDDGLLALLGAGLVLADIGQVAPFRQQDRPDGVAETGDAELLPDSPHPLGQLRQMLADPRLADTDVVAFPDQFRQAATDGGVFGGGGLHHGRFGGGLLGGLGGLLHDHGRFVAAASAQQVLQLLDSGLVLSDFSRRHRPLGVQQSVTDIVAQPFLLQHGDLLVQGLPLSGQRQQSRLGQQEGRVGRHGPLQLAFQLDGLPLQAVEFIGNVLGAGLLHRQLLIQVGQALLGIAQAGLSLRQLPGQIFGRQRRRRFGRRLAGQGLLQAGGFQRGRLLELLVVGQGIGVIFRPLQMADRLLIQILRLSALALRQIAERGESGQLGLHLLDGGSARPRRDRPRPGRRGRVGGSGGIAVETQKQQDGQHDMTRPNDSHVSKPKWLAARRPGDRTAGEPVKKITIQASTRVLYE